MNSCFTSVSLKTKITGEFECDNAGTLLWSARVRCVGSVQEGAVGRGQGLVAGRGHAQASLVTLAWRNLITFINLDKTKRIIIIFRNLADIFNPSKIMKVTASPEPSVGTETLGKEVCSEHRLGRCRRSCITNSYYLRTTQNMSTRRWGHQEVRTYWLLPVIQ